MPAAFPLRPYVAAASLFALGASFVAAQTVDDVVRRYVEARGGAAKLRAVESLRFTGTMELPEVAAGFVLELERPSRMRTEFVVQGQTGVRAFDGQHAWERLPLPGEEPRPMAPEEAAEARAQADVDLSPLVDSAAKGFTVELVGRTASPGARPGSSSCAAGTVRRARSTSTSAPTSWCRRSTRARSTASPSRW